MLKYERYLHSFENVGIKHVTTYFSFSFNYVLPSVIVYGFKEDTSKVTIDNNMRETKSLSENRCI